MKISFNTLTLAMLCGLIISLVSCSGKSGGGADTGAKNIQPLASVVVLPAETFFDKDSVGGSDPEALRKGADLVDITMAEELTNFKNVRVLSKRQVEALMKEDSEYAAIDAIKHLGSVLHSDAVLIVTVNRYRQRVGGEYAAESPASASFTMRLIDAKTKAVLWSADFDETQESLLSNILTFNKAQSRGFKWVTVENLLTHGLRDRLADCPYLEK